jgi:hypothetical protein
VVTKEKATRLQRARQQAYRVQWFENKIAYDQLQIDRLKALGLSDSLNADIKKNPGDFANAILDTLGRRALEISNDPQAGAGMVKIWLSLYLQAISFERNQNIRERKMALREMEVSMRKEKFDKLKKTVQNSRLSDEEKAKRCREIFNLSNEDKAQTQTNGNNGFAA